LSTLAALKNRACVLIGVWGRTGVTASGRSPATRASWVEAGGNYYGGSAGAVLATNSIAIADHADSNDVGLLDFEGLGLLPAIGLLPHYTVDQQDLAQSFSRDLGQLIIAVPEAAGLVVGKGTVETVGPEEVWTVTSESTVSHAPGSILSSTDGLA
jgi:dipeptidase E